MQCSISYGNEMATKNRIAYALPIIQIMQILLAKSHKQKRLRLIYRERVGIISTGLQVPGNPWKQRAFGHFAF